MGGASFIKIFTKHAQNKHFSGRRKDYKNLPEVKKCQRNPHQKIRAGGGGPGAEGPRGRGTGAEGPGAGGRGPGARTRAAGGRGPGAGDQKGGQATGGEAGRKKTDPELDPDPQRGVD